MDAVGGSVPRQGSPTGSRASTCAWPRGRAARSPSRGWTPESWRRLVRMVEAGELSGTNAKEVFARHAASGRPVAEIVAEAGFTRISDTDALRDGRRER